MTASTVFLADCLPGDNYLAYSNAARKARVRYVPALVSLFDVDSSSEIQPIIIRHTHFCLGWKTNIRLCDFHTIQKPGRLSFFLLGLFNVSDYELPCANRNHLVNFLLPTGYFSVTEKTIYPPVVIQALGKELSNWCFFLMVFKPLQTIKNLLKTFKIYTKSLI